MPACLVSLCHTDVTRLPHIHDLSQNRTFPMTDIILSNARIVLEHEVIQGSVLLRDGTIAAIEAALEEQRKPSAQATLALHQAELWRDRLIADDDALTTWLQSAPDTDVQQLRALIRQARKDAQATAAQERPGEAVRHGRAYREIFQQVKAALARGEAEAGTDTDTEPSTDHD